jgi:heat shock protein HslJ
MFADGAERWRRPQRFCMCCGVYRDSEVIMKFCRVRSRFVGSMSAAISPVALGCAIFLCFAPNAFAQSFPFGSELRMDANPMRGSKRIPVLDIGENGTAEIELWCNSVKAQLIIAANTITIITGEMSARQCPSDRARADEELVEALNQTTNWRMDSSALVLTGGKTLRFHVQTN